MTKSAATLEQLASRVHQQAMEVEKLRTALDVQFKRIADMQAELDLLPQARKRRQTLRAQLGRPQSHNGDGHA